MSGVARRLASFLGVLAVVLGSVVLFSASPAFACSCIRADASQQAEWAAEVFVGTVTDVKGDGGVIRGDESVTYSVAVDRVWKGSPDSSVRLETASNSASCGVGNLPEGREVAFFVSPGEAGSDRRHINSCGGTTVLTAELEAEITATLGDPYPAADIPLAPTPGPPVERDAAGVVHDPLMPRATKIALAGAVLAFPAVLLIVVGLRRRRA